MGDYILKKSEQEDLEKLCNLAIEQNNMINLNLVYMTLKLTDDNYDEVMKFFSERGYCGIHRKTFAYGKLYYNIIPAQSFNGCAIILSEYKPIREKESKIREL